MRQKHFSRRLQRHSAEPQLSNGSQPRHAQPCLTVDAYQRTDCSSGGASDESKTHVVEEIAIWDPTRLFPETVITTNLGTWDCTFRLYFSHILPDDPSIAVFSSSQSSPVPITWRDQQTWSPWDVNFRCRWRKGKLKWRRTCSISAAVGPHWRYKISSKAIRYQSPSSGILLVDWSELFDDYIRQKHSKKNKKRVHDIVNRFNRLEERVLVTETGGTYGDWGIKPATNAEVALACGYEGLALEFDPDDEMEGHGARNLMRQLRHVTNAVKGALPCNIAR